MSETTVQAAEIPTTGGTRAARIILIGVGGVGTLGGLFILLTTVKPAGLFGLAVWLLGALILHDGILSPTLFLAQRALHTVGKRIPGGVLAFAQVAVLLGGILTLVVIPEIIAQAKGPRNSSVLDLPYGFNLFISWIVITVVTVVVTTVLYKRHKRALGAVNDAQNSAPAPARRSPQAGAEAVLAVLLSLPVILVARKLGRRSKP